MIHVWYTKVQTRKLEIEINFGSGHSGVILVTVTVYHVYPSTEPEIEAIMMSGILILQHQIIQDITVRGLPFELRNFSWAVWKCYYCTKIINSSVTGHKVPSFDEMSRWSQPEVTWLVDEIKKRVENLYVDLLRIYTTSNWVHIQYYYIISNIYYISALLNVDLYGLVRTSITFFMSRGFVDYIIITLTLLYRVSSVWVWMNCSSMMLCILQLIEVLFLLYSSFTSGFD